MPEVTLEDVDMTPAEREASIAAARDEAITVINNTAGTNHAILTVIVKEDDVDLIGVNASPLDSARAVLALVNKLTRDSGAAKVRSTLILLLADMDKAIEQGA